MQAFIGIDVSKATLDLALYLGNEYKASFRIDYSIKEIEKVISDFIEITGEKNFIFGCEATGVYHLRLANYLFGLGYKIKILNPRISYFYHCAENITSSTDKVSAKVIARQLINDKGPFWEPEEEEINRMRGLLLRRNQILAAINREKCRLDRFQDDFYPRESIIKHLEYLKKDKEKVEKELRRIIQKSHKLKKNIELLTSIDCVGFLTASVFLAKIGNVNRFSNANKVVKFLGLCPENKRSGTSVNSSRLSKKVINYIVKSYIAPW